MERGGGGVMGGNCELGWLKWALCVTHRHQNGTPTVVSAALQPRSLYRLTEIEEVDAAAAPAVASHGPQDVPKDELRDVDTTFGAVENDETEAGVVTTIYEDLVEQDNIVQLDAVVPQYTSFDHGPAPEAEW